MVGLERLKGLSQPNDSMKGLGRDSQGSKKKSDIREDRYAEKIHSF